jgi:hypothetical protein
MDMIMDMDTRTARRKKKQHPRMLTVRTRIELASVL